MDVTGVAIDGRATPEFALADFNENQVLIRVGLGGTRLELGPSQGINHPESVMLADINNDGIPDLVVANTNGNNILVFPGLGNDQFGPEENGGAGFSVGLDPVSVTINYVNGDPALPQLIVANAESDSVTILNGQAAGGDWTPTSISTLATMALPVKTLLYDVNDDGSPDLLVCNSGSNSVTLYEGMGSGSFNPVASATFQVGTAPEGMFVGRFDKHAEPDLVTINSGSDDLTFIGDAFGSNPTTQTISSGGTAPDAAFSIDPGHTGIMDLVVANGGDGNLAVFRGGNDGLQLIGLITQADVTTPTALAPDSSFGNGFDFFAAGAGSDAALLLHFDLGIASAFLPGSSQESGGIGRDDSELFAQLMPFDEASLELIGVLWAGSPDSDAISLIANFRDPATITALYSPTEGQGGEEAGRLPEVPNGPPTPAIPATPPKGGDSSWARVVSGVVEALDRPFGFVGAIAARDAIDGELDRPIDGLARLDPDRPFDPDLEATPGIIGGGAIRLFWPEATPGEGAAPADTLPIPEPIPGLDGVEATPPGSRLEAAPLISVAVIVSTRLILNASPPRGPRDRARSWFRRFVSPGHDPRAGDRPNS